jgi:putative SOS response-associated peptidase YedK
MCGRYTLHTEKEALAARFGFEPRDLGGLAPRYNVAPTQNAVVVRPAESGHSASFMRWGWCRRAKTLAGLPQMINARQGIAEKPRSAPRASSAA